MSLKEDIAALRKFDREYAFRRDDFTDDAHAAVRRVLDALEEAREVLEFYADGSKWHQSEDDISRGHVGFSQIEVDDGAKARDFLTKYPEGKK